MAGKINKKALQKIIFENKDLQQKILKLAEDKVNNEKKELIDNFLAHPVTQEIEGGENANNISGTLGGYGNLFSFIGFSNGSNPVTPILNMLKRISISRRIKIQNNTFLVDIYFPSKEELSSVSRMPWETGRSWLWDVEKTISGLGSYLFGKFASSRSGTGIESKYNFRNKVFTRVSYFTPFYNNFIKKIGGKLK